MRWSIAAIWILTLSALVNAPRPTTAADAPLVIDLWPEGHIPGEPSGIGPEADQPQKPGDRVVRRIANVTHPTLTVHRPPADIDTGAAVLIAPGGGYYILAWDLEGEEVAAWLNQCGITAILLKYRVPRRPGFDPNGQPPEALQDAQRGLSLVRSRATEWGIDPARIGMLGFSAGGDLTARAALGSETRSYEKLDAVDNVSCRPDFGVLIYPGYLEKDGKLRADLAVTPQAPPMFFAHAADDGVSPLNSVVLFQALHAAGVPAELHIYASGGHGFGLRPDADPCSTWPARCADWFRSQGILTPRSE